MAQSTRGWREGKKQKEAERAIHGDAAVNLLLQLGAADFCFSFSLLDSFLGFQKEVAIRSGDSYFIC